eukprot:c21671_g1_i1 orf=268-921(+)
MAADFSEDVAELTNLLSQATRPRVRFLLSTEIENLEKQQKVTALDQHVRVAPLQTAAIVPEIRYTTLSSFSWDQDSGKVKIYVPVEGANEDKVISDFQQWSFDVKVHDVQGKNFRSGIHRLHKAIVPEKCTVSVKPKRIVVTLWKAEKGNWADLYFKEDKLKPKFDSNKDPMAGIMDVMKNMYDEGDDDMKRTIAKAWSEARSGKKSDPLKGLNDDL